MLLNADKKLHEAPKYLEYFTKATSKDKESNPYYSIPGHSFMIPFSSIINLNFTYYKIDNVQEGEYKIVQVE